MMYIRYFTEAGEYANRTRDIIPRIGEEVRFKKGIFKIKNVLWIEDDGPARVHILIEEVKP